MIDLYDAQQAADNSEALFRSKTKYFREDNIVCGIEQEIWFGEVTLNDIIFATSGINSKSEFG